MFRGPAACNGRAASKKQRESPYKSENERVSKGWQFGGWVVGGRWEESVGVRGPVDRRGEQLSWGDADDTAT